MKKILVIDDKKDNLIAITALLRNLSPEFEIETAQSGRVGIPLAQEWTPDVVLLDISMPDMDGYKVCRILKSDPVTEAIPVVLLTAYKTDTHSRVQGLNQGADAFLTKPVEPSELLAQITAMLRIKQADDRLRDQNRGLESEVSLRTREVAENRLRYQLLYDYAPDIYCNVDEAGCIININHYGATYLGYRRATLIGTDLASLFHKDDQPLIRDRLRGKGKRGESLRMLMQNQAIIHVSERTQRIPEVNRVEGGTLIILRDVTESYRIAEKLRRQEAEFRTLYEQLPVGVYRTDVDGKILLANPALVKILGYDSFEQLRNTSNLYDQHDYSREKMIKSLLKYGHIAGFEHTIRKRDSTKIVIRENAVIVRDEAQSILYFEGTIEDITLQLQTEQALKDAEARFSLIAERANDAMIVFDRAGHIQFWNYAAERMFLCSKKDATASRITRFLPFGDEIIQIGFQTEGNQHEQGILEETGLQTDGTPFPLELSLSRLVSDSGQFIVAILRDVSERKILENEREEALLKAQHGEKVKSLFIANMSHEIRTPLNTILGFSNLLSEELLPGLTEEQQSCFESIKQSGTRLTQTIHSILNLSQLEAGAVGVTRSSCDLVPVVDRLVAEHRLPASTKGLSMQMVNSVPSAFCLIDEIMITEALSNLLDNAVKYTQEGSISVCLSRDLNWFRLTVSDTGIGISEEFLPRLFEPFSQASEGYTKQYQGIGLGLALSKRYIELNNGKIEVYSEPGVGTTIEVFLPSV